MSEVKWPNAAEADGFAGTAPDIGMPRLPMRVGPDAPLGLGKARASSSGRPETSRQRSRSAASGPRRRTVRDCPVFVGFTPPCRPSRDWEARSACVHGREAREGARHSCQRPAQGHLRQRTPLDHEVSISRTGSLPRVRLGRDPNRLLVALDLTHGYVESVRAPRFKAVDERTLPFTNRPELPLEQTGKTRIVC